ncbi:Ureidoglycolate hydrolase [Ruegeria marisrubri]|uniref:Ureidoglycolate hydrolase n=1 Tax=Ruegeria marisrubri TaxID=1685379 RepID=A0A0X3THI2_9RHOB|nr:ureidoglycolate lyase [Ruegeria marisrubri]KUJ73756.1 Ureidoglycolate hydrolase [Ruegeria marisrubri]
MSRTLKLRPLTAQAFAPFGDVIEAAGAVDKYINQGKCARYHDRAQLDFSDGRAGISVFQSQAFNLPITLDMVERHPDGSQAFLPLSDKPFVVVVAPDIDGTPGQPLAFKTAPGQGVNYHRNTWHGVLTPLFAPGLFAVVDRIGSGPNLEEHWFQEAYTITD